MSIRYLFLLSFPVCIGTTILAEDLIVKIYGQAFISSVLSLQILIWIVSLFPVAMVFARALVASNHQTQDLVANILGVLFIVVLNYMLIPRYGFIGSAAAMLVSICLFTFVQYNFFRRVVSRIHASSLFWKPFCAGALMGVFTFYLRGMNIFLLIPLAACVYAGCLFLLQTFSPEEVDAMRSLYRNKFHSMLNRG
jgi:O-antigen/teichoic acid export membrane protein